MTSPQLTPLQRAALLRAYRAERFGEPWIRATGSGERVTLASLERRGYLTRRAWRGVTGEPDAAHEYRIVAAVAAALSARAAA